MKTGKLLLLAALIILAGCRKEAVIPVNDRPFPMDANKDLAVAPGDDFFRYCNGSWLRNATLPEGKRIYGGLYVAANLAEERMDALYAEDPLLSRVMADANAMFSRKASWKLWIQVRIRIQALTESFQDMLWRFLPRAWALIPSR